MSIHTYSVVVFTEDNSIEAVPTNWLKKNKCAWPTTKNQSTIRKLIERKSVPNEIDYTYLNARALKTTDSLLKAREMTKKGLTRTDISSAEDYDDVRTKRKSKGTTLKNIMESSSSFPTYSASEDDADDNSIDKPKARNTPVSGWSPSPKKSKFLISPISQNIKSVNSSYYKDMDHHSQTKSISRKLSYSNVNEGIVQVTETITKKPLNCDDYSIDNDGDSVGNNNDINIKDFLQVDKNFAKPKESQPGILKNDDVQFVKINDSFNTSISPDNQASTNSISHKSADYGFQKDVLHRLAFIKHELRRVVNNQLDLSQRFETFESKYEDISHASLADNQSSLNNVIDCHPLPMDNTIDLQTFDDKISGDSAFRINLTNQLSYIGGKHIKSMIKRIMSKLFTDELLKLYSFSGKKGKIKFSHLAVCSVIFDAVKQNHKFKNVTQNDMEEVIKYVLAQAPFNIKRLEKKK